MKFYLIGLILFSFLVLGCVPIVTNATPGTQENPTFTSSSGKIYYVSPTGSDSNSGTLSQPWRSPGYASRKLKPGDTLIILGGTYILSEFDADIISPTSGTQNAWITIKGEEGQRPILKGTNNLLTAIDLSGKKYVKIENLEITNYNNAQFRDGIEILNNRAEHIIFKDLYIHHLDEFGINISDVDGIEILNCEISYCGFGAIGGPSGASGGWKNAKLNGCTLSYSGHYYQGTSGPGPYDRPDGFGIEPSEGPIEILNTKVEHNRGDGLDSKAANTYIHECIVANNFADGIKLWRRGSKIKNCLIYGRGDGDTTSTPWASIVIDAEGGGDFKIINTTIDDTVGHNYLIYVQYDHPDIAINLDIVNTIFSARGSNSPIYIAPSVRLMLSHNLFYMPRNSIILTYNNINYTQSTISTLGEGNLYGDPLFVRTAFGNESDYRVQSTSPAIDNGTSQGAPTIDILGNSRPQGGGFDIGAYER